MTQCTYHEQHRKPDSQSSVDSLSKCDASWHLVQTILFQLPLVRVLCVERFQSLLLVVILAHLPEKQCLLQDHGESYSGWED